MKSMIPARTSAGGLLLGLLAALPWLVGCQGAIVGHWTLVEATPSREVFSIERAHFGEDGTFAATMTIEGQTTDQEGTYEFTGFKLKLRPKGGGQREYNALLKLDRLRLSQDDRRVILRKQKGN